MKNQRQRSGAVTVEMAFCLPILFLVVFASIEFGRMNIIRHTASNAAYEAARRAIVPGSSADDAKGVALDIMQTCGAQGVRVTVSPSVLDENTEKVTVDVDIDANDNGLIAPNFFKDRVINGRSTLRREQL